MFVSVLEKTKPKPNIFLFVSVHAANLRSERDRISILQPVNGTFYIWLTWNKTSIVKALLSGLIWYFPSFATYLDGYAVCLYISASPFHIYAMKWWCCSRNLCSRVDRFEKIASRYLGAWLLVSDISVALILALVLRCTFEAAPVDVHSAPPLRLWSLHASDSPRITVLSRRRDSNPLHQLRP